MPQLLVTTPVTLTDLVAYFVGWSFNSAIRTPRAAHPVITKALRSATANNLFMVTPRFSRDTSNGRARSVNDESGPGCGDASACLKLRIPGDRSATTRGLFKSCARLD